MHYEKLIEDTDTHGTQFRSERFQVYYENSHQQRVFHCSESKNIAVKKTCRRNLVPARHVQTYFRKSSQENQSKIDTRNLKQDFCIKMKVLVDSLKTRRWLFFWALWHINLCWLFNAKSIF